MSTDTTMKTVNEILAAIPIHQGQTEPGCTRPNDESSDLKNSSKNIDGSFQKGSLKTHSREEGMGINLDDAFPDKWLKAATIGEVGDEAVVTIAEIMGLTTFKDGNKSLDVRFHEFEQILGMNKTNRESVAVFLKSRNTDDWVGKKITIYVDLVRNQSGQMVPAVRVRPAPRVAPRPQPQQRKAPIVLEDDIPYDDPDDPGADDSSIPF